MRAVILAAGQGSRLLPLTLTRPKCLVEVDGRTILDRQLDALAEAGVVEAAVVGGYRMEVLADHLAARPHAVPVRLIANPFWAVSSSIGSVWAARDLLHDPFLLLNGDTLYAPGILSAATARADGVALLVQPLDAPHLDDMLVRAERGRVVAVAKDLPAAHATHRSMGAVLSAGGSAYADALDAVIRADGGVQAFHHAVVARLAAAGAVAALEPPPGRPWQEIDRPQDIAAWEGAAR